MFPGRRLPRGVRANRRALAVIDYDGLVQRGVADGTAGILIRLRGVPLRLYVDVYRNLGGSASLR